ncbi:MAG: hypothetical protein Q7J20_02810 [Candidatus Nitrotoga sp.]|nr:hypothetical protein [Candidatus Nitrotoga sp.]MDO9446830.1 hypothetical protein [Candidatus Nitrotoga sp.]
MEDGEFRSDLSSSRYNTIPYIPPMMPQSTHYFRDYFFPFISILASSNNLNIAKSLWLKQIPKLSAETAMYIFWRDSMAEFFAASCGHH